MRSGFRRMRARGVSAGASAACVLLLFLCAAKCYGQDVAPKFAEYVDALAARGLTATAGSSRASSTVV